MTGSTHRSFLEPCLLLLLREQSDHGYNLVERLRILGMVNSDPAAVYRALRNLEREDLVQSQWTPSSCGPARRTYHLTLEGCATLGAWIHVAEAARDTLDECLARWELLQRLHPDTAARLDSAVRRSATAQGGGAAQPDTAPGPGAHTSDELRVARHHRPSPGPSGP